jgi:hypothetical protein
MDIHLPDKPLGQFDDLPSDQKEVLLMIVRGCLEKMQEVGLLDKSVAGSIEQQEAAIIGLIDEGVVKPELFKIDDQTFQARLTVWNGLRYVPIGKFMERDQNDG